MITKVGRRHQYTADAAYANAVDNEAVFRNTYKNGIIANAGQPDELVIQPKGDKRSLQRAEIERIKRRRARKMVRRTDGSGYSKLLRTYAYHNPEYAAYLRDSEKNGWKEPFKNPHEFVEWKQQQKLPHTEGLAEAGRAQADAITRAADAQRAKESAQFAEHMKNTQKAEQSAFNEFKDSVANSAKKVQQETSANVNALNNIARDMATPKYEAPKGMLSSMSTRNKLLALGGLGALGLGGAYYLNKKTAEDNTVGNTLAGIGLGGAAGGIAGTASLFNKKLQPKEFGEYNKAYDQLSKHTKNVGVFNNKVRQYAQWVKDNMNNFRDRKTIAAVNQCTNAVQRMSDMANMETDHLRKKLDAHAKAVVSSGKKRVLRGAGVGAGLVGAGTLAYNLLHKD